MSTFNKSSVMARPLIFHSYLPRHWLVEVGAINFASTILPTCEEVGVIFILWGGLVERINE